MGGRDVGRPENVADDKRKWRLGSALSIAAVGGLVVAILDTDALLGTDALVFVGAWLLASLSFCVIIVLIWWGYKGDAVRSIRLGPIVIEFPDGTEDATEEVRTSSPSAEKLSEVAGRLGDIDNWISPIFEMVTKLNAELERENRKLERENRELERLVEELRAARKVGMEDDV